MKMVKSTELTDAFYDYWSDGEKVEFLEALDGAIAEIKEEAEFEGVCSYCGADLDYDDASGEYECHECGYNGGYVPDDDRLEDY